MLCTSHMHSPTFVVLLGVVQNDNLHEFEFEFEFAWVFVRVGVEWEYGHRTTKTQIYRNVYLMETKFYDCVTMEIITITIIKIRLDRLSRYYFHDCNVENRYRPSHILCQPIFAPSVVRRHFAGHEPYDYKKQKEKKNMRPSAGRMFVFPAWNRVPVLVVMVRFAHKHCADLLLHLFFLFFVIVAIVVIVGLLRINVELFMSFVDSGFRIPTASIQFDFSHGSMSPVK